MIENNLKKKKSRQAIWDEYRNIKVELLRDFIMVMKK